MKADVITESPAEPPANVPVLLARLLEPLVEDAIDQLAVLSGLGSRAHGAGSGPTPTVLVGDEISEIIARQRELELEYDKVLGVRAQLQQDHNVELLRANDDKLRAIAKALKQSTSSLCAALRMTNASGNAMVKFQNDRQFAQLALEQLLDGLRTQAPSCQPLVDQIEAERQKQASMAAVIVREQEARQRIKTLRASIAQLKESHVRQVQEYNSLIAQLKDECQATRVRLGMEADYLTRQSDLQVEMAGKKTTLTVLELKAQLRELTTALEEEQAVSAEVQSFLQKAYSDLKNKLQDWTNKSEADTVAKQGELDDQRAAQAKDLNSLQELTERYNEYNKIVQKDLQRKEKMRLAAERAIKELAAAIRIQAWWRGLLVRHKMGPYKDKKKSAKSSKKKGGKKKK